MRTARTRLVASSVVACLLGSSWCRADSGTAEYVASFVVNYAKSEFGDTTLSAGGSSGTITITKSTGGPFVDGTSGLIECIVFAKKSPSGLDLEADCTSTFSPGDRLLWVSKRRSGDVSTGVAGEGTSQIVGGTGRFSGMSGQCSYKLDPLGSNRVVSISKCQWQK